MPRTSSGRGASSSSSRSGSLRRARSCEGIAISVEIWSISTRLLGVGTEGGYKA